MPTQTMLESVFFFSSIMFLVFEVYSKTTPGELHSQPRKQRSITFENDDNSIRRYDSVQSNEFQSCDASSYCAPIRRCSSLRHLWYRKGGGVACGPFRRVCCPKEEVPIIAVTPPAVLKYEAVSDDSEQPNTFRTCDSSSYCIPIRRCSSLREGWNRRGVGITCGLGVGPYRMVCCPRGYGMEVTVRQEIGQTRPPRTTTPLPPPGRGNSEDCGLSQGIDWFRENAMNETDAVDATWPWMVAIVHRTRSGLTQDWCSGFLISRTLVLSAAHCFSSTNRAIQSFSARIGSDDLDSAEEYPFSEVKLYEEFKRGSNYHDIAILTLAREVNVSNFVPICLPDDRIAAMDLTGWGATIVGWGSEVFGGPPSKNLKQLDDVPILSNRECSQIYETLASFERQFPRGITEDMLCAGLTEASRDACVGDSGGPLMVLYRRRWYAVGITSFGYRCGVPGIPGGYTRISSYMDWIRQNTENGSLSNAVIASTTLI